MKGLQLPLSIDTITVGPLATNCYLAGDSESGEAFIVDPGFESATILSAVSKGSWSVTGVIITHAHFDHIVAAKEVVESLDAPLLVPSGEVELLNRAPESARSWLGIEMEPLPPYRTVSEGDTISAGRFSFRVVDTPGHSPGGISLIGEGAAFVGDTVFAGSIGRTDFPGGDFEVLMASIRDKLLPLDDNTTLYCGHGPSTTIGEERRTNPFILQMLYLSD